MFKLNPQYYYMGDTISAHNGPVEENIVDELSFVLFLYPRDWTPVCTKEIIDISRMKDHFKIPVFVGSANMPEAHAAFYSSLDEPINVPALTVTSSILDPEFKEKYGRIIFNEYDVTNRRTILCWRGQYYIKEGHIERPRNIVEIIDEINFLIEGDK